MTSPTQSHGRRLRRTALLAALVALALVAAAVWWFFLRDDSPEAFDLDDAVAGAVDEESDQDASGADAKADEEDEDDDEPGVEGTWTVDPDAGAAAGGTAVGFRVAEELSTIGATEAVGRTSDVDGTVTIDGSSVTEVSITADLTTLATDDSRRDRRMHDALDTATFPTASFVLTEPIELATIPAEGETLTVDAVGELTIKGVTNPATVAIEAQRSGGTLVVVGRSPIVFADYGVEPPSAPIVLSVADEGTIEVQLFLTR